jgi:hypothetical protein
MAAISERLAESAMHALLAIVIFAGGMFALSPAVDAGRKYKRSAQPPCSAAQPRHVRRANLACARGAWGYNPYDPVGEFRGFPGWARKAFSEGRR